MKRWVHATTKQVTASGVGKRTEYVLIDYPDRTPVEDLDTGYCPTFKSEEEALNFIDEHPWFHDWYPGLKVDTRTKYNVWHPNAR